jgi:RND family efflux transporter MFP subunit
MLAAARRRVRVTITLLLLVGAVVAGVLIWNHYLTAPWTRDGQVLAYVVDQAPEVSGRVAHLHVTDNQRVKRGDVLYEIDPIDYQIAVASAEANLQSRQADMDNKKAEAARREELSSLSTSVEEKQNFASSFDVARAAFATAVTQLNQARVDLERTKVLSPVNGYITNLQLQEGDYATKGTRNLSILNTDSFWIVGYFEETKIAGIRIGDPAVAALMGFRDPVRGHVQSIAQGINTPNTSPGSLGLASVNPVFTWVRLAQRIPVRIHIDTVPDTVQLAAGMTATVTVGKGAGPGAWRGLLSRLFTQVPR